MDIRGQARAEFYYQILMIISALIGLCLGYARQDFMVTVHVFVLGFFAALLVSLPDWPMYNRHPIQWQPVKDKAD
jgi:signal peptidase complex subunit 1